MQRIAKVFMNNRSQAVRIPKEFQFSTPEVFIRKQGDDVILSARPKDWSEFLAAAPVATEDFMDGVEARSLGLTLVTNNRRKFHRVPGLSVENWAQHVG
jgi:antitoxin VapB